MRMKSAPQPYTVSSTTRQSGWRGLFLTGASLMVLSGSAMAADLPIAKAPPPAIATSWAGFYLGVHGGYGWKQDDFSQSEAFQLQTPQSINGVHSQGAVYGGQAGYNWQFGRAVTGLEIDFTAANIKGSNGVTETTPFGNGTFTTAISMAERVQYLCAGASATRSRRTSCSTAPPASPGSGWMSPTASHGSRRRAPFRKSAAFGRPPTSSAGSRASAPK